VGAMQTNPDTRDRDPQRWQSRVSFARWRSRLDPVLVDVLPAILAFVTTVGFVFGENLGRRGWISLALAHLQAVPLLVRRSRPLPVLAVVVAVAAVQGLAFGVPTLIAVAVALYTVAAHCERRIAIRAGLAAALVLAAPIVVVGSIPGQVAFYAAAWILGDNLRTRRAYLHELEARAERLEREREEEARRAVAEEQARIAREFHDVIAHSVAVMVVQASAADDIFETNPARAREAIRAVKTTGRQSLDELRRLLAAVRPENPGDAPPAPQPTLARLADLVAQVRATGLAVDLTVAGEPRELPAGVELTAYRVVQEALTNTLKHAHASRAGVTLSYDPTAVRVDVGDDGRGAARGETTAGRGIIGMRERVALFGGEFVAGPMPNGGFRVAARIPLQPPERP
jgi:signal transduction histidine kinase